MLPGSNANILRTFLDEILGVFGVLRPELSRANIALNLPRFRGKVVPSFPLAPMDIMKIVYVNYAN